MKKPITVQEAGRTGGLARSEAKTLAARANAKRPRKPWDKLSRQQRANRRKAEIAALAEQLRVAGVVEQDICRACANKCGDYRLEWRKGKRWSLLENNLDLEDAADLLWVQTHNINALM